AGRYASSSCPTTWTTSAWHRSPRRSPAASRRSSSIPARSRWSSSVRPGRWTLPARLIDGVAIAKEIRAEVARDAAALAARGVVPGLTVVLVGDDPASAVYVRAKERACGEAGMNGRTIRLPATTTQADLLAQVD